MTNRTVLNAAHRAAGAKMVDFHGWDMPLNYGSQVEEHHAVRRGAGFFDVSHMTVVDFADDDGGASTEAWLRRLLANDVARLEGPGRAQYTAMLDESGGVIDDLIAYRRDGSWRLVVNSATREADLAWMNQHRPAAVRLTVRDDVAMLAVQGPAALQRAAPWLGEVAQAVSDTPAFTFVEDGARMIARTGYTGEDGFEAIIPAEDAEAAFAAFVDAGIQPAGLAARDTLRLEAGMNLYGQDMDRSTTPLESNMGWVVAMKPEDRDFIGRAALEAQKAGGVPRRLVGVVLEGRGVLRGEQILFDGDVAIGTLTSGAFSPTIGCGIGLARVDADAAPGKTPRPAEVEIRGKRQPVRLLKPPFVRGGEPRI